MGNAERTSRRRLLLDAPDRGNRAGEAGIIRLGWEAIDLERMAEVRFDAHNGLKLTVALCPKSTNS